MLYQYQSQTPGITFHYHLFCTKIIYCFYQEFPSLNLVENIGYEVNTRLSCINRVKRIILLAHLMTGEMYNNQGVPRRFVTI